MTIFSELLCAGNIDSSFSFVFSPFGWIRRLWPPTTRISRRLLQLLSLHSIIKILSMAPPQDPKEKTKFLSSTAVKSLKAAIFHRKAFKMSLEINNDKVTSPTKRSFPKVFYNVCNVKKKNTSFEQYARIHLDGPKIALCENG